jgi:hypothetical protein
MMGGHVKTVWFVFWVASLTLGALGAVLGRFHISNPEAWRDLTLAFAGVSGTISTFLAAQWQKPEADKLPLPGDK